MDERTIIYLDDAIDTVKRILGDYEIIKTVQTALYILPPAQPQRTGHWIKDDDEMFVTCSECNEKNDYISAYCPDCGVKMEDNNESD